MEDETKAALVSMTEKWLEAEQQLVRQRMQGHVDAVEKLGYALVAFVTGIVIGVCL